VPGKHAGHGLWCELVEVQPADLRRAESMPEHQEQPARVMGFVVAAAARLDEAFNFARGKVLSLVVGARPVFPLPGQLPEPLV
jgi:hypothetical protein